MFYQEFFSIKTGGRGTYDISEQISHTVSESRCSTGLCHVFIHHTSASLILCENADPTVRQDLERFMNKIAPDGDPLFQHIDEGPDDMPAHVRAVLTQSEITLPVTQGRCGLGIWQGVYLWEHRTSPHGRKVTVTINGEK